MPRKKKKDQPQTTAQQLGSLIKSARDIMRKDKGLSTDLDRLPMLTWIMFLKFLDDKEDIEASRAKMRKERFRPSIEPPYRWRDWAANESGITGPELLAFINQDEAVRPDGTRGPGLFAYLRDLHDGARVADRRKVIATVFRGVVNRMTSGYLLREVINKVNGTHFLAQEELFTLGHLYETMLREMRDAAGQNGEFYTPRPVVRFMVEVTNPRLGETVLDPACGTGGFLAEAFTHLAKQCKKVEHRRLLQEESLFGGEAKPLPYLLVQMNLLLHGLEAPQIDPENSLRFPLGQLGDKDRVDVILTNPPFGGEEEKGILSNFPEDKQAAETALLFLQLIMRKLRRVPKPGRAAVVVPESVVGDPGVAQRIRKQLVEEFNLHTVVRLPKGVFEPYSDIQTNLLFFDRSGPTQKTWFYQHEVPEERRVLRNPCYTRTHYLRYEELQPIIDWWGSRKQTTSAWHISAQEIAKARYSLDFRNPARCGTVCGAPTRIVPVTRAPLTAATQMLHEFGTLSEQLVESLQQNLRNRPLAGFLSRVKEEALVDPEKDYKQATVRLYGKGVVLRKVLPGSQIKTRPQFVARAGHLIMSRIDARNGAFGIVPPDLDGAVVTQDFPLFHVNEQIMRPAFLALLLRSEAFMFACKKASRGTTNRKRLREEMFLAQLVPVPDGDIQDSTLELLTVAKRLEEALRRAGAIAEEVIPAIANYVFSACSDKR